MKAKLWNIAVTVDQEAARWVHSEAARNETSISRLLGAILKERMLRDGGYERAMRRALARETRLKTRARYLSREEAHDRTGLR